MKINFVVHEAFEGSGYFDYWVAKRGYKSSYTRVYLGELLPAKPFDFDCLIILGGPQNPSTSIVACSYFDSEAEQRLIRSAINDDKAVIGICLGAQLIGESLGASYEKSPEREIGYFPIKLTTDGKNDPLIGAFNSSEIVGHWHNDMPGLTDSAKVLAESEGCPRQIVRYSALVYGFQCHLEFISCDLPLLIKHSAVELAMENDCRFIQAASKIVNTSTSRMNQLLENFLDRLVIAYSENKNMVLLGEYN